MWLAPNSQQRSAYGGGPRTRAQEKQRSRTSLLKGIHSSRSREERMPTGWASEWKALKLHKKDLCQILHSYEMSKGQKVGFLDT